MKSCGPCTLCCTVLDIPELSKPGGRPCAHLDGGCTIYPDRPTPCRVFTCGWLALEALDDTWRPDVAGFLLRQEPGQLCIDTAPEWPLAWQAPAYLPQIKLWSRRVWERAGCVVVFDGDEMTVVFPEENLVLGAQAGKPLQVGYRRQGGLRRPMVRLLDGETLIQEWLGEQAYAGP